MRRSSAILVAIALSSIHSAAAQTPSQLYLESYDADPQHSTVEFVTRMLGVVKVRGRFTNYDATIVCDTVHPERSSVTAIIRVASLTTDMAFRDTHLKSPDFFDAEHYPTIEFQSDRVVRAGRRFLVTGRLTMHGVTRTMSLPVTMDLAPHVSVESGTVGGAFETSFRISRKDFGIAGTNTFNPSYNPATTMLADSVDIILELSAHREGYANRTFGGRTPPSIADTVGKTLQSSGAAAAVALYRALHVDQPKAYNFSPGQLDALARFYVAHGRIQDALALFKVNAEAFPTSSGVVQGLAEAYMLLDDRDDALATYEHALQLDASNTDAIEMIRRLRRHSE